MEMIVESGFYRQIFEMQRNANTAEEVKHICDLFSEAVGFEYYIFAICSVTSLSSPEISTITNYPSEWLNSYFNEKFQRDDPVVRYCFEQVVPVRWDHLLEMEEYTNPAGEMILNKAAEAGLAFGISIPMRAPTGEISIFSLSTSNPDNIDYRLNDVLAESQAFGNELFNTMYRINLGYKTQEKESLTPREIECLFWACEGKTTWEISKIINVAERTVIFHLTGATKKLGAVNRQHAVAKAITSGLIKPML